MREGSLDRGARRRAQTRSKLVAAARELFARQGVEATRIAEITEEADVGLGSFYNHFDSKESVVDSVIEQALAEHGAMIDAVTRDIDDPAEVVAVAHRHLVSLAFNDTTMAWLLFRLSSSPDIALVTLADYARRDLERGLAAGRFVIDDVEIALEQTGGALFFVLRGILDGRIQSSSAAADHVAGVLRLLGVDADEAREIAARPQPVVDDR